MPGPPPKNPATRQRTNRTSTHAKLSDAPHAITAPELPEPRMRWSKADEAMVEAPWHEATRETWAAWWASPMAPEWVKADHHGLFLLIELVQLFGETGDVKVAAEIRQQRQNYGLTPLDRRRLQWEIERTEDARARGGQRRGAPGPRAERGEQSAEDVRNGLRAV